MRITGIDRHDDMPCRNVNEMSEKQVEIPEGVEAVQEGASITVKGPKGELSRDFRHPKVRMELKGSKVKFISDDDRKKTVALLGTFSAHVRNMVGGVTSGWESRLKAVYSHFPMKLAVEGDAVVIQNFMGERSSRRTRIVGQTRVDIKKDEIIVTGIDKEDVGQTAANIEQVTKVTRFDRRIFQDGIYITQKCIPIEDSKGDKR
jgi:large subunit ribosomal protein L6